MTLRDILGKAAHALSILSTNPANVHRKKKQFQGNGFQKLEERTLMAVLQGELSETYIDRIVDMPSPTLTQHDLSEMYVDQIVGLPSPTLPAPSGLVGFWDFSTSSGTTAKDVSGSRHNGSVSGATWTSAGRVGGALSFDGVDDLVDTGSWDVAAGALTISTWFRADDFSVNDGRLVSKATGVQEQDHYWMLSTIDSDGPKLRFRLKAGGTTETLIADQGNLAAGQWMHAAAVYDGSMMRLYLDGVEVGATPHSGQVSTNANARVAIGNNPDGSRPFDGVIDQVQVYDKALTPGDIAALIAEAPATNLAPVVNVGSNRSVVVSATLALDATVTDDGLPDPNVVTTTWNKVSGPGAVTFSDASAVDTTATFTQAGTYVLQLVANDGELVGSDTLIVTVNNEVQVSGFFVSTNGTSGGDGSINNPWNLQTALSQPAAVQAGDTLWLRGGTYRGGFTSQLTGTANSPITVRSYPGERATLDAYSGTEVSFFNLNSDYVHWRDLEFTNSSPLPRLSATSGQTSSPRTSQIQVRGDHNKLINNIVHDMNSSGIGFWEDGAGGELYGNIIYNNGNLKLDRGHGHGIYMQNEFDTKIVENNIVFNNFSHNFHMYGTSFSAGPLIGAHLEGNVFFNSGAAAGEDYEASRNLLIGGQTGAANITLRENYTYQDLDDIGPSENQPWGKVTLGFSSNANQDLTLTDNYFHGKLIFRRDWDSIASAGNTVIGSVEDSNNDPSRSGWSGTAPATGIVTAAEAGLKVEVSANQYEAGRGHVVIYNWDELATVPVDLSSVLNNGDSYEIHHVYDLDGTPLVSGMYNGSQVAIPMQSMTAPALLGDTSPVAGLSIGSPISTGPEFGAFVVRTLSSQTPAPLLAADGLASAPGSSETLTSDKLQPIVDHALDQWEKTELTEEQTIRLNNVQFHIDQLPGNLLGQADENKVTLDINGANYGWFVDPTPELDNEFVSEGQSLVADSNSDAEGRIDLLTVVMHELGHVLGYDHSDEHDLMAESLGTGIRKTVIEPDSVDVVDEVFHEDSFMNE